MTIKEQKHVGIEHFEECVWGLMTEQGIWRNRTNEELKELYKTPDVVSNNKGENWSDRAGD
jgi:hypothetical protein